MNSLEQYLKPPTKNQEEEKELYKEEENGEKESEYIQNEDNENEIIENQESIQNNGDENEDNQNSKNKNLLDNNPIVDDDNDIIKGINLIGNIGKKDINIYKEKNEFIYNNKKYVNNENEKNNNEYDYMNKYNLNININQNSNKDLNSPEQLMKEILFKINRFKENRAKSSNKINKKKIDKEINLGFQKTKIKNNNNEYIGKLNINNQVVQNNPKMKELVNILKDYNKDKNENDKIQLNFYNTNQINIIKPEIIFNNMNNFKNKNIDCYNKKNEEKYYISAIDGKAIINGQRLEVKNELQLMNDNLKNKKLYFNDFNDNKNELFYFINDNFMEKRNKLENNKKIWNTGNNLDFKLNNFNFSKKNENFLKTMKESDNKKEIKKINKNNFLSKDFYNEELNKINNSLFNIDNKMYKLNK